MTVVRFPHSPKLANIGIERAAFARGKLVAIQNVLQAADRVIQFTSIELAAIPLLREVAQAILGVVQTVTIVVGKVPPALRSIQIVMHPIDQRRDRIRSIGSVGMVVSIRPVLAGRVLSRLRHWCGLTRDLTLY